MASWLMPKRPLGCLPARDRKEVKKTTKIEIRNGVELYDSTSMKLGETVTETVADVYQQDFRSQGETTPKLKWVLVFETGKGLSLNVSNTRFLIEHGVSEYEHMVGRKVTLVKEARVVETKKGQQEVIGIFIKEIS